MDRYTIVLQVTETTTITPPASVRHFTPTEKIDEKQIVHDVIKVQASNASLEECIEQTIALLNTIRSGK